MWSLLQSVTSTSRNQVASQEQDASEPVGDKKEQFQTKSHRQLLKQQDLDTAQSAYELPEQNPHLFEPSWSWHYAEVMELKREIADHFVPLTIARHNQDMILLTSPAHWIKIIQEEIYLRAESEDVENLGVDEPKLRRFATDLFNSIWNEEIRKNLILFLKGTDPEFEEKYSRIRRFQFLNDCAADKEEIMKILAKG